MSEPEKYHAVLTEKYDPADDEGYRERLQAAWFDGLHQCGGTSCGTPTLEPIYEILFDEDDYPLDERGPQIGYIAVGLAWRTR